MSTLQAKNTESPYNDKTDALISLYSVYCIVSIIERRKRNIGEKTACQQCSILPPHPPPNKGDKQMPTCQHSTIQGDSQVQTIGTRIWPTWHKIKGLLSDMHASVFLVLLQKIQKKMHISQFTVLQVFKHSCLFNWFVIQHVK